MIPNHASNIQVEGEWDDLIREPSRFAGQRVRVIVLSGTAPPSAELSAEIRQWLDEGNVLAFTPPAEVKPDAFGDVLVEKFRKQGLVL